MKRGRPIKESLSAEDFTKPEKRDVYIVDDLGNLIKKVTVYNKDYAVRNNLLPLHIDWKESVFKKLIKSGDYVLCDDGWVVKVVRLTTNNELQLETGNWVIRKSTSISSYPNFKLKDIRKTSRGQSLTDVKYTLLAVEFLANGFDIDAAYLKFFKKRITKRQRDMVFNNNQFRRTLQVSIGLYYANAGIDITVLLKNIYTRTINPKTPFKEVLEATRFLFDYHPDFLSKSSKSLPFSGDVELLEEAEIQDITTELTKPHNRKELRSRYDL